MVNVYLSHDSDLNDERLYIQFLPFGAKGNFELKDCIGLLKNSDACWVSGSGSSIYTYIGDSKSLEKELKKLGKVQDNGKA